MVTNRVRVNVYNREGHYFSAYLFCHAGFANAFGKWQARRRMDIEWKCKLLRLKEMIQNEYFSDESSPPRKTLESLGIAPAELAMCMSCPPATMEAIIHGETLITPAVALALERVLGVPTRFWLERERHYRAWQ